MFVLAFLDVSFDCICVYLTYGAVEVDLGRESVAPEFVFDEYVVSFADHVGTISLELARQFCWRMVFPVCDE